MMYKRDGSWKLSLTKITYDVTIEAGNSHLAELHSEGVVWSKMWVKIHPSHCFAQLSETTNINLIIFQFIEVYVDNNTGEFADKFNWNIITYIIYEETKTEFTRGF